MKKYIFILVALMVTGLSVAQDASNQQGAVQTGSAAGSVDTIYTLMIAACAAIFLFVIIYALARAVKALSSQVSS